MQILKFQFEDKSEGWRLNETSFNDRMTLLVGASGVGKTLILKALRRMKRIAQGSSDKGAEWRIEYITPDGNHHLWEGAYQNFGLSHFFWVKQDNDNGEGYSKIEREQLTISNKVVVKRDASGILFNNSPTLKLSPQESILKLFKEEEQIKPSYEGFCRIEYTDYRYSANPDITFSTIDDIQFLEFHALLTQKPENLDSLAAIRKSNLPTATRLFLVQEHHKDTFELIQNRFISIFPQVTGIKSDTLEGNDSENDFSSPVTKGLFIHIQEQGMDHWINPNRISSGMYKTLLQLCDLYLCPDGTVFLMDEFENSLGINCIREIAEDIILQDRPLQFIVTSHHPYIINNIPYDYWKIVTRNGGIVKTHSLADLGHDFSRSKHEAFMQLMQLDEFLTGQEQINQEQEDEHLLLGRR